MRTSFSVGLNGNGFFTWVEWGRLFIWVEWGRLFNMGWMGWMGTAFSNGLNGNVFFNQNSILSSFQGIARRTRVTSTLWPDVLPPIGGRLPAPPQLPWYARSMWASHDAVLTSDWELNQKTQSFCLKKKFDQTFQIVRGRPQWMNQVMSKSLDSSWGIQGELYTI